MHPKKISIKVFKILIDKILDNINIPKNMINAAIIYLYIILKMYLYEKIFLVAYIWTNVTDISAITVANAAPYDKRWGISNKLKTRFTTVPVQTEIV